jgi:hypothetical protein
VATLKTLGPNRDLLRVEAMRLAILVTNNPEPPDAVVTTIVERLAAVWRDGWNAHSKAIGTVAGAEED